MKHTFVRTRHGAFLAIAEITKLVQINGPNGTFYWKAFVREEDFHELEYETGFHLAYAVRTPMPYGARALFNSGDGLEVGETLLAADLSDSGAMAFYSINGEHCDARGVLYADGSVDLIDDGHFESLSDAKAEYAKRRA